LLQVWAKHPKPIECELSQRYRECSFLETHPERPFLANDDIENKGFLGREIAKKRLSGFVSRSPFLGRVPVND
jgi:hypothetical protein